MVAISAAAVGLEVGLGAMVGLGRIVGLGALAGPGAAEAAGLQAASNIAKIRGFQKREDLIFIMGSFHSLI